MTAPLAFDPANAGWSWDDLGITQAEAERIPVSAEVEAYSARKDPVRSGKILGLAAPSPLLGLPNQLARLGVNFGVIDGWGSRGYLSMSGMRGGLINHWIVSKYNGVARRQSLGLIVNGHSTLAGPLANLYLDFDGWLGLVAALSANHGGIGAWNGVAQNPNWVGIECEGGPGGMTPAQLAVLPKINAAVALCLGRDPVQWCIGHHEYAPKRKQDIGAYMPPIRAEAARLVRSGPTTTTPIAPPTRKVKDMLIIFVPGSKDPHVLIAPKFAMGLGPAQIGPLTNSGVPVVPFAKPDYDAMIKAANR